MAENQLLPGSWMPVSWARSAFLGSHSVGRGSWWRLRGDHEVDHVALPVRAVHHRQLLWCGEGFGKVAGAAVDAAAQQLAVFVFPQVEGEPAVGFLGDEDGRGSGKGTGPPGGERLGEDGAVARCGGDGAGEAPAGRGEEDVPVAHPRGVRPTVQRGPVPGMPRLGPALAEQMEKVRGRGR